MGHLILDPIRVSECSFLVNLSIPKTPFLHSVLDKIGSANNAPMLCFEGNEPSQIDCFAKHL